MHRCNPYNRRMASLLLPSSATGTPAVRGAVGGGRAAMPSDAAAVTGNSVNHPAALCGKHSQESCTVNPSQLSPVDAGIAALLASYTGDAASDVGTVILAAKDAAAASKSQSAGLFSGFLTLSAKGCGPAAVRRAGTIIRANVTQSMRVARGLSAVKKKGSKESGAPDFSTASVYAGIVADLLTLQAADPDTLATALSDVDSGEVPIAMHDESGFPATKSACQRVLKRAGEIEEARVSHQFPALSLATADTPTDGIIARLERDLSAARAQVATMLEHGDAAGSLAAARAERDSMLDDVIARDAAIAALTAERDALSAALAAAQTALADAAA